MMYIFAIQLVDKNTLQGLSEHWLGKKTILAAAIALVGFATVVLVLLKNAFIQKVVSEDALANELNMDTIGKTLMSADKYGYVLPFEFISLFLLACIIGGLVILNISKKVDTNKDKEEAK